ncbi:MAG: FixH family protein [Pseudomonadota bacterium]
MMSKPCMRVPVRAAWLVSLCALVCACARSPAPPVAAVQPAGADAAGSSDASQSLNISFQIDPDPPRAGDNSLAVTVTQPDGKVLADAAVSAVFYMPAMPSMGMPEMRSAFPLAPAGNGTYRGSGNLVMSGTWNVTVNVSRGDEKLGSRRLTIIAK